MKKKIFLVVYIIVAFFVGFVIFGYSLYISTAKTINKKSKVAAKNDDYEFFLKYADYYDDEFFYQKTYTEMGTDNRNEEFPHSTMMTIHNGHSVEREEDCLLFLVNKINTRITAFDEDVDGKESKIILRSNDNIQFEFEINTSNYPTIPMLFYDIPYSELIEGMKKSDGTLPTSIKYIEFQDPLGKSYYVDNTIDITLTTHDNAYWKTAYENEEVKRGYTNSSFSDEFYFVYPEAWSIWRNILIFFLVFVALGIFIFKPPRKHYDRTSKDEEVLEEIVAKRNTRENYFDREAAEREKRFKSVRKLDENGCIIEDPETVNENETTNEEETQIKEENNDEA